MDSLYSSRTPVPNNSAAIGAGRRWLVGCKGQYLRYLVLLLDASVGAIADSEWDIAGLLFVLNHMKQILCINFGVVTCIAYRPICMLFFGQ
jgi:hypothetical protein